MKKEPSTTVRLDRWLSAARFYKTRTQAARACEGHKIKVNGKAAKPHKFLHVGELLVIHKRGRYRNIKVMALAERGLPPKEARELYVEEVRQPLSKEAEELITLYKDNEKKSSTRYKGRPTKRERRKIDKLKDLFR